MFFFFGVIFLILLGFAIYFSGIREWFFSEKTHVRGSKFLTEDHCKEGRISIAGTVIPDDILALHFIIAGGTGSGKSQALQEAIQGIRDDLEFGGRAIFTDSGGEFLSKFYREGDTILNPFDARSVAWNPFAEIRNTRVDFDRLAISVVPEGGSGTEKEWALYARNFLSDVLQTLFQNGVRDPREAMRIATAAPREELKGLLVGTSSETHADPSNDKLLGSIRVVLSNYIRPWRFLSSDGDFSMREWIKSGEGAIWLTYRDDMMQAYRPLLATLIDIAITEILSGETSPTEIQHWISIDELDSLGMIQTLPDLLTRGRKYGVSAFSAIQSIAQLEKTNGKERAQILLQCFSSSLTLLQPDPQDADYWSRRIGEVEQIHAEHGENEGSSGKTGEALRNQNSGSSVSYRRATERLVLPSELQLLPKLAGVLKLAGEDGVRVVKVPFQAIERVEEPFIERED